MRQLFEMQLLNVTVRSKSLLEHVIAINNSNNAVDSTASFHSSCLIFHEWHLYHGAVQIK